MKRVLRLYPKAYTRYDTSLVLNRGLDLPDGAKHFRCQVCRGRTEAYRQDEGDAAPHESYGRLTLLLCCHSCGRWIWDTVSALAVQFGSRFHTSWSRQSLAGTLHTFDLASDNAPMDLVAKHLALCWEDRRYVSPKLAEDLVGEVLREHYHGDVLNVGSSVYAKDGGIDLFICHKDGHPLVAVQVKRRASSDLEGVRVVREFVGALILSGHDHGAFVTTAGTFSRDALAVPISPHLAKYHLQIDLVAAGKLLELLHATHLVSPAWPEEMKRGVYTRLRDNVELSLEQIYFSKGSAQAT